MKNAFIGLFICAAVFVAGCSYPARCPTRLSQSDEAFILKTIHDQKSEFHTDGACDTDWSDQPAIRALVKRYRQELIPVLINNLDNTAPSQIIWTDQEYNGRSRSISPLPMGCVCFDLLCCNTKPTDSWWYLENSDDGFWANVKDSFMIDLDASEQSMKSAKKNWIRGYMRGKVVFDEHRTLDLSEE
jgi:hypothetical protein